MYGGKARQHCDCYSWEGAEALARWVDSIPLGTEDRKKAERDLITRSATVEVDDDGRVVLPPQVREKLGMTPEMMRTGVECAVAGSTDRFALWRGDIYRADEDEDDDGVDALTVLGKYPKVV